MGRDVGGHTHGDSGSSVNEQIRDGSRHDNRLGTIFIVRRLVVDGIFFKIRHHRRAHVSEAGLGITHGGGSIPFDRAEVTLTVDQGFTHRPWLGHIHEGGINGTIAVRMIFTHRLTHDTGTLEVSLGRGQGKVMMHRIEQSSLRWLQAITRIGQGPGNDDGHRIVQKGLRHLVGNVDRLNVIAWRDRVWSVVRHGK